MRGAKGEDGEDQEGGKPTKSRKGKGRGRGRGKGKGKGKQNPAEVKDTSTSKTARESKNKGAEKDEGSKVDHVELEGDEAKPTRKGRANAKAKAKAKAKASPKAKSKAKASPKKRANKKSKPATSEPSAPSGPDDLDGAGDAGGAPGKAAKRVSRRVATPQNSSQPLDILEDFKHSFKGEIAYQWKSGRTKLTGEDFTNPKFEQSTLSPYYTRARPSVGLKARKKDYPQRTNLEYANFSFNLKDVCNIGLAMKCALVAVSWLIIIRGGCKKLNDTFKLRIVEAVVLGSLSLA